MYGLEQVQGHLGFGPLLLPPLAADAQAPGLTKLSVHGPGWALGALVAALAVPVGRLAVLRVTQSAEGPLDALVLPAGLTALHDVTLPGEAWAALRALPQPAGILRGPGYSSNERPLAPPEALGPRTQYVGALFQQPPAAPVLRSIQYLAKADVPVEMGWRTAFLDLVRCEAGCTVHCETTVLRVNRYDGFATLRSRRGPLVVQLDANSSAVPPALLQALLSAYPTALALQVVSSQGIESTVFPGSRLPADNAVVRRLVVALGIASGLDTEAAQAILPPANTQYRQPRVARKVLETLVVKHAGPVVRVDGLG